MIEPIYEMRLNPNKIFIIIHKKSCRLVEFQCTIRIEFKPHFPSVERGHHSSPVLEDPKGCTNRKALHRKRYSAAIESGACEMNKTIFDIDRYAGEGPQSALEKKLIEQYLSEAGYTIADLREMPIEQAQALMQKACRYASLKLAEVESKTKFRKDIEYGS